MRKTFLIVISVAVVVMLTAIVVFRYGLDLPWLDSTYFVVTTMMTVGYGDISLKDASAALKIFGIGLMLASGALMACVFGIITDYILRARLEQLLGRGRSRMRNHIVLCGMGNVGIRILEQLTRLGEQVIVIDRDESGQFLDEARQMNVTVLFGDMRRSATLERANIKEARSLIAATSDDLANLEVGLNARELRPDIRVVLRIFDHNLANKIQTGFGIRTSFSTSALAAPAFAMAAVDPAVVGSFYIGQDLMLVLNLVVAAKSPLDGSTVDGLTKMGGLAVLCHEGEGSARQIHPPDATVLRVGDKVVISVAVDAWPRVKAMNQGS